MIAHRGFACGAPENSLRSVQQAWAAGADAVEVDVRVSAEDVSVLAHDLEQVSAGAQLANLLSDEGGPGYLLLDIKETRPQAIDAIVSDLSDSIPQLEQVVFQSDYIPTLQQIRSRLPDARLYYVHRLKRQFPWIRNPSAQRIVKSLESLGIERVSLKGRRFISANYLLPFRNANIGVNIWTVNNVKNARKYREMHVAGLITDETRLLAGTGPACERL